MEKEDKNLQDFLVGYTEAMLNKVSNDDDKKITLLDFDDESRQKILNDCFSFVTLSNNIVKKAIDSDNTYSWKIAGWDFWETRNSTGLGFEDKVDYEENKIWKNLFSRAKNKPVSITKNNDRYIYGTDDYSFQNPDIIKAIQEKRFLEEVIPKTYESVKEMVEKDNIIVSKPKLSM